MMLTVFGPAPIRIARPFGGIVIRRYALALKIVVLRGTGYCCGGE